jgi:hypothetical protein
LFGKNVDPMVVTESCLNIWDGKWYWRTFVVDRNRSYSIPLSVQRLGDKRYSDLVTDKKEYLAVTLCIGAGVEWDSNLHSGTCYNRNYQAISKLHVLTTELVNEKNLQETVFNEQVIEDVENKLQHVATYIADYEVKACLREKLLHRARTSMVRKQQKREAEIDKKAQEILDAIPADDEDDDDEDDDGETATEKMPYSVNARQPTKDSSQPSEIDWRGECYPTSPAIPRRSSARNSEIKRRS